MDGAQITILVIVGIIILFFIKYKITGSVKREFTLIVKGLDKGYEYVGATAMIGALISLTCAVLIMYSVAGPPAETTSAEVVHKESKYNGPKYGHSYKLYLIGEIKDTDALVSRKLYDLVSKGDQLEIELSPVFADWRRVNIVSRPGVSIQINETEFGGALIIAMVCLLPLGAFPLYFKMKKSRLAGSIVLVIIILFELIPIAILTVGRP